jgi:hypothetical protein
VNPFKKVREPSQTSSETSDPPLVVEAEILSDIPEPVQPSHSDPVVVKPHPIKKRKKDATVLVGECPVCHAPANVPVQVSFLQVNVCERCAKIGFGVVNILGRLLG